MMPMTLLNFDKPMVMGIVNATPDSFSGDGVMDLDTQVKQALNMIEEGADILDIGGESTRPDATPIDLEEELSRVLPLIGALRAHTKALISIDTMKSEVARQALMAGANIINDVTGGRGDDDMHTVMSKAYCPVILMHNKASWQKAHGDVSKRAFDAPKYKDIMAELCADMKEFANDAIQAGISKENIILDAGIGFGKTVQQNCLIIKELKQIKALGYTVLLGPSRKSFIGQVLDVSADDRLEGTMATVALGIANGADVVRVHDVKEIRRVVDMTWAIKNS